MPKRQRSEKRLQL